MSYSANSSTCKTRNGIVAGNGMILGLKWLCIVVVNYQRQHKFNSFDAVQCDIIAKPLQRNGMTAIPKMLENYLKGPRPFDMFGLQASVGPPSSA